MKLPQDPNLVYFANETSRFYERMQLIDALELQILPDDPENIIYKIEFTWDLLAYNEDIMVIQLYFVNPWAVSDDTVNDKLSVTFWGVEFFKSLQGKEVEYGTTLYWPIMRQISETEKVSIQNVNGAIEVLLVATFAIILPVIAVGSLLPTWIFINSLQIIAHTVLLKTLMPANAHYFLSTFLDWLRLFNEDFFDYIEQKFDMRSY